MLLALFEERAAMLLLSSATRTWGFLSKGHCLLSQLQQHSQQTFVARRGQRATWRRVPGVRPTDTESAHSLTHRHPAWRSLPPS